MANRTCSVDGCERRHLARGWCSMHYQRWKLLGDAGESAPRFRKRLRICEVADCSESQTAQGLCAMHYARFRRHGDPEFDGPAGPTPVEPSIRFWPKVEKTEGCWIWTGATDSHGYGYFNLRRQTTVAHRFAYEELVGPIPEGLELDHLCRNPSCVNPDHLEPVTHAENIRRIHYRKERDEKAN